MDENFFYCQNNTLKEKGLYALVNACGKVGFSELQLYTNEEQDELDNLLENLISKGVVTFNDGYYEAS